MVKSYPTFEYEIPLWGEGFAVVGIDEVGRGALAGPLGVGAVMWNERVLPVAVPSVSARSDLADSNSLRAVGNSSAPVTRSSIGLFGINDSKKLSEKQRNVCCRKIYDLALFADTVHVDVETINTKGITQAFEIGVQMLVDQCLARIKNRKLFLLIDGFKLRDINGISNDHIMGIIRGDSLSLSIAAASIIAKVARDEYMKNLSEEFPQYGFAAHVGYGTPVHRNAILKFGKTPHHRDLYIRNILGKKAENNG